MNKNIWRLIELICYILKFLIDNYDTRREKPQSAEHQEK